MYYKIVLGLRYIFCSQVWHNYYIDMMLLYSKKKISLCENKDLALLFVHLILNFKTFKHVLISKWDRGRKL